MGFPRLSDVVDVLDHLYPPRTAQSWDSVGLITGQPDAEVRLIHFAVDPVIDVVREATRAKADLLVTHHPLFLRGVHSVSFADAKGEAVHRLIRAGTALYNAHTNADAARPGVSDALARTVGLDDLRPLSSASSPSTTLLLATTVPADAVDQVLDAAAAAGGAAIGDYRRCAFRTDGTGTFEPGATTNPTVGTPGQREHADEVRVEFQLAASVRDAVLRAVRSTHPYEEPAIWLTELQPVPTSAETTGIGRIGRLVEPLTLERFALHVAEVLPFTPQGVRVAGDPDALVETVAVCGGSGDSLFDEVRAAGVDAYLTADLRHHPTSEARETARGGKPFLIDVAHWASEWPWLHGCASLLQSGLLERGFSVEVRVSELRTDPWTFRIPSSGGIVR